MGKLCGIEYEMKVNPLRNISVRFLHFKILKSRWRIFYAQAYVGDTVEDKLHKMNSVQLAIRKVFVCFSG